MDTEQENPTPAMAICEAFGNGIGRLLGTMQALQTTRTRELLADYAIANEYDLESMDERPIGDAMAAPEIFESIFSIIHEKLAELPPDLAAELGRLAVEAQAWIEQNEQRGMLIA